MDPATFSQLYEQVMDWNRNSGLNMIDLLEMPDPLRQVMNWIVRKDQISLPQFCEYLQCTETNAQSLVDSMTQHRLLTQITQPDGLYLRAQLIARARKPQSEKSILDDF